MHFNQKHEDLNLTRRISEGILKGNRNVLLEPPVFHLGCIIQPFPDVDSGQKLFLIRGPHVSLCSTHLIVSACDRKLVLWLICTFGVTRRDNRIKVLCPLFRTFLVGYVYFFLMGFMYHNHVCINYEGAILQIYFFHTNYHCKWLHPGGVWDEGPS